MKHDWTEQRLRWQKKGQKMMRGRYAQFDLLSRLLISLGLLLVLSNIFINVAILRWFALILFFLAYYRFFSKKIYVRVNENTKYKQKRNFLTIKWKKFKKRMSERQTYKYFNCPNCKQSLRAPKKKGKIKITCSNCHSQFIKST